MQRPKEMTIEMPRSEERFQVMAETEAKLPEKVDLEGDAGLLQQLSIEPSQQLAGSWSTIRSPRMRIGDVVGGHAEELAVKALRASSVVNLAA